MIDYYIIEHPTRGLFLEWSYDYENSSPRKAVYKPKFSHTALRNDEKVKRYWRDTDAIADVNKLAALKGRSKCTGAYVLHIFREKGRLVYCVDLAGQKR